MKTIKIIAIVEHTENQPSPTAILPIESPSFLAEEPIAIAIMLPIHGKTPTQAKIAKTKAIAPEELLLRNCLCWLGGLYTVWVLGY